MVIKQTTKDIKEILIKKDAENIVADVSSKFSERIYQEVKVSELLSIFLKIKGSILNAIEIGVFDDVSFSKRNIIKTHLNNILRHKTNYNQVNIDCQQLNDLVRELGLYSLDLEQKNYEDEIHELRKLNKEYSLGVKLFDDHKELFDKIKLNSEEINEISININEKYSEAINAKDTIDKNVDSSLLLLDDIRSVNKDVESMKLSIETFKSNIDEYKTEIDSLKKIAEYIIAKEEEIDKLIDSAENALNLKSAEGLSAALSTQYEDATKWNKFGWWIILGILFFLMAIIMTIWIVSGYGIKDPNSWNSIIGRIVAIGVAISAAAFSARQYTKQKNIIEDYAYKLTLAKSIVAFKDEMDDTDDIKSYLTKVLDEIHKDPLRSRVKPKEIDLDKSKLEYFEKLVDFVKNKI